ncbi:MAG: hypothetical protein IKD89_06875 [Clostridia bacterium]|nr:hypothetical protein [Clostridia bacterium]
MHMTDVLGFAKKPFSAHRPDCAAFLRGAYADGMVSVFRAPKGVYIAAHVQNLPKDGAGRLWLCFEDTAFPLPSRRGFAYLAFYTDMYNIHDILYKCIFIKEETRTVAGGTIMKYR